MAADEIARGTVGGHQRHRQAAVSLAALAACGASPPLAEDEVSSEKMAGEAAGGIDGGTAGVEGAATADGMSLVRILSPTMKCHLYTIHIVFTFHKRLHKIG